MDEQMTINGGDLIAWGYTPGAWFKDAIGQANLMQQGGADLDAIQALVSTLVPKPIETIKRQDGSGIPCHYNITVDPSEPAELDNLAKVRAHMHELAGIPTIRALAVMPDACPAGSDLGTIPVGGVAVAEGAIHPGMHSNDICCSVALSVFSDGLAEKVLDAGMKISHFGPGGRQRIDDMRVPTDLMAKFFDNKFTVKLMKAAREHYGSQGDGNHFFYVGRIESTDQLCLVTHHGSRKPGAELYRLGIQAAWDHTRVYCPDVPKHNAWIPYDSEDGEAYWEALQLIREWTKSNHFAIHDAVAESLGLKVIDRYWNEHNFCFKRGDYFYHAKGATPNYLGFASDGLHGNTLIPLNMAAPILVCAPHDDPTWGMDFSEKSLGFCPHGAGRNFSRTGFMKSLEERGISPKEIIAKYRETYDIRAFTGKYDISEFPEAYKSPEKIVAEIETYNLTTVVDRIQPYGSIMAGHTGWSQRDKKKKAVAIKGQDNTGQT
jgi:tRNA-splicing ligase RtcB